MRKLLFCLMVSLCGYAAFAQRPTTNLVISWDASALTDVEDFSVYSSSDLVDWSHYASTTTNYAVYPIPQGENKKFFYIKANKLTPATNSVTLDWTGPNDPTVDAYRIYFGVKSRDYTNYVTILGGLTTTTTIYGLRGNTTYYFSITSVNLIDDLESDYDGEVWTRTPAKYTQHNVPTKIQKQ